MTLPRPDAAIARVDRRLISAASESDTSEVDRLLEERYSYTHLATNWDADMWGMNPDEPAWWEPFEQGRQLTPDEADRLSAWAYR